MKILSLDSSSVSASVSITENGKILAQEFINNGLTHSQTLMPMVEKALKDCGISIKAIDLIAVTHGPGSFTGVRIGIASAKGIADALNINCFPVSTLEAIARPLADDDVIACAVMDARCNQVYCALFSNGKRLCEDKAILISELGNELKKFNKNILLIGDGAVICYEKLKDSVDNLYVAKEEIRYIHASSVAFAAEEKINAGENTVNPAALVPFYLRLPQAERELNNKKSLKKE